MHYIKVAHITDTHILKDSSLTLNQINPLDRFKKVISTVAKKKYDLIIFTGDIADDGNEESYNLFFNVIEILSTPCIVISGNHDNEAIISRMRKNKKNCISILSMPITINKWNFLYLNTNVAHQPYGELIQEDILLMKNKIEKLTGKTCVIMHHPVFPSYIGNLDQYNVKNPEYFLSVCENKIDLAICGHIHGDHRWVFNKTAFESAPSTIFQFENDDTTEGNYRINNALFGYKEYFFYHSGYQSRSVWFYEKTI